jgi:hypothetical protein
VKNMSEYRRVLTRGPFGSFKGLSRASKMLDIRI